MPVPQQQQFILPFLQILGEGERHTRQDIMTQLVQRFGITPIEEK